MNNYFTEDVIEYSISQLGGEYVAVQKPNRDWLSFGFGVVGGVSTALWYAGVLGSLPLVVSGIGCTVVSMYLVMPENMTTQDKVVLAGGLAASVIFGFAVVNNGIGYALMSASILAISYKNDSHDILKQISPSLSGLNLGFVGGYKAVVFAASAVTEAKRANIGDPFAKDYNPDALPKGIQHNTGLVIRFHNGVQVPSYLKPELGGTYAIKGGRTSAHATHVAFGDYGKVPVNIPIEDGGLIGMLHDLGCWNPLF